MFANIFHGAVMNVTQAKFTTKNLVCGLFQHVSRAVWRVSMKGN